MKTFGLDQKYKKVDFEEVSVEDLELISGGSGAAGSIAMGLAGGWAATVAGFAIGGPVGAAAGFALGSAITIGYALATSGGGPNAGTYS